MFSGVAWFVLLQILLAQLKNQHAGKFIELGSPSLLQTPRTEFKLIRFIFGSESLKFSNPIVVKMCIILRLLFLVWTLSMVGMIANL